METSGIIGIMFLYAAFLGFLQVLVLLGLNRFVMAINQNGCDPVGLALLLFISVGLIGLYVWAVLQQTEALNHSWELVTLYNATTLLLGGFIIAKKWKKYKKNRI